jgi:hypothetical protein
MAKKMEHGKKEMVKHKVKKEVMEKKSMHHEHDGKDMMKKHHKKAK